MNSTEHVKLIADAVLYEGYVLYPYRPSIKNRQRWTFGAVVPREFSRVNQSDDCRIETQCLVLGDEAATLDVRIRFLHVVERIAAEIPSPLRDWPSDDEPPLRAVPALTIGKQRFESWQEAVEREVVIPALSCGKLMSAPRTELFAFPGGRTVEPVRAADGVRFVGALIREQRPLTGVIELVAEKVGDRLWKVGITVINETPLHDAGVRTRDEAMLSSLVSTHTILFVSNGEFVSLMDPPDRLREAAATCRNHGTWPVLVGEQGDAHTMLAAPIILYDYPQIASESPGDLFDSTEIDEILTLRIMTLTEDEQVQMEGMDARTRELLRRTTALGGEQLSGLHGAIRPWGEKRSGS